MINYNYKLLFLVNDKVTEYPKTINVLKRFNLYPELAVGTAKRIFDQVSTSLKWKTKECWQINRGEVIFVTIKFLTPRIRRLNPYLL